MTGILASLSVGALASAAFAVLWFLAKNKAAGLQGSLDLKAKDLDASQANLEALRAQYEEFVKRQAEAAGGKDAAILKLQAQVAGYQKLLRDPAVPAQVVADRLGQLFPEPGTPDPISEKK